MQFSLAHSCVSNCKTTADHTLQYSPTANLQGDRMQPAARGSGDDLEAGTIEVECPATPASVSVDSPRLTELHQTSAVEGVPSTIEPVRRCKVQPRSGRGETGGLKALYFLTRLLLFIYESNIRDKVFCRKNSTCIQQMDVNRRTYLL